MTRRRIDLDEEGWFRIVLTGIAVFALAATALSLGAPPPGIYGGLALLSGIPAWSLWVKHFNDKTTKRDTRPADLPHRADEAVPIRGAVDRAQDTRHG